MTETKIKKKVVYTIIIRDQAKTTTIDTDKVTDKIYIH